MTGHVPFFIFLVQILTISTSWRIIDRRTELNPAPHDAPVGVCDEVRQELQLLPHDGKHLRDLPDCDEDGLFSSLQCHDLQPLCWCVHPKSGLTLTGTEREIGPHDLPPNCGPCQVVILKLEHELAGSDDPESIYIPQCAPDGMYHSIQCDISQFCWCADPLTGAKVEGSEVEKPGVPLCQSVVGSGAQDPCGPNEELQSARCACCPESTCENPRQLCCLSLCQGPESCGCKPGFIRLGETCVQSENCPPNVDILVPNESKENVGCPIDWIAVDDKCYKYMYGAPTHNWVTAVHLCRLFNARLPVFYTREQWSAFNEHRHNTYIGRDAQGVWLGLHDLIKEGEYLWIDENESVHDPINNFSFWYSKEARNPPDSSRDCVASLKSGSIAYGDRWVALDCNQNQFPVFCQRDRSANDIFGTLEKFIPDKDKDKVTGVVTGVTEIVSPFTNTPDAADRVILSEEDTLMTGTSSVPRLYMQLMVVQGDGGSKSVAMGDTEARTVIETLYKNVIRANQTINQQMRREKEKVTNS